MPQPKASEEREHDIIPGGCRWVEDGEPQRMECVNCYGHGVCEHEPLATFLLMNAERRACGDGAG